MASVPTPAERRRARVREELMASALSRFERDGYERTTIAQIANDANMSPRSFFRYFGDKEEVLFPDNDALISATEELVSASIAAGRSPWDAVCEGMDAVAIEMEQSHAHLRARRRVIQGNPALTGRQEVKYLEWQRRIRTRLDEDQVPENVSHLVVTACFGIWREAYRRWLDGSGRDAEGQGRVLKDHLRDVRREVVELVSQMS
ncbi:MAG: TetR/AcrR family transcriptional regulator [Nocardioides sp.]